MKKRITSILKKFGVIVVILVVAITILELLGFRFMSKNVLMYDSEESPVIHTSDWDFYYFTFSFEEDGEECGKYIAGFQPVKRYGLMYKRLDEFEPKYAVYTADGNEYLGALYCFEGRETQYYIFRLLATGGSLPPLFVENWVKASAVTINGQKYELQEHSFFSTDVNFSSFFFANCELVLRPFEAEE